MSISPDWTAPAPGNVKSNDFSAIRDGMWNTLFFSAASIGAFQIRWNLVASTKTAAGLPTMREWNNSGTGHSARITWDYTGNQVASMTFEYNAGGGWAPTVPSACVPVYGADGLLLSYAWVQL